MTEPDFGLGCPDKSTGRRVLLVDDDPALLRLVSQWLMAAGVTVNGCDNFEDARRELTAHPPDVLLTDLRLGAFNGLQLVILAIELNPAPLTVVMSAYDDPILRSEAERRGARYLLKPFSSQDVLKSIGSMI